MYTESLIQLPVLFNNHKKQFSSPKDCLVKSNKIVTKIMY